MAHSMKDMPMADEASRQQVLDGYRIVDSLPEDTYQDIVQGPHRCARRRLR